jgi:hypothetical protein
MVKNTGSLWFSWGNHGNIWGELFREIHALNEGYSWAKSPHYLQYFPASHGTDYRRVVVRINYGLNMMISFLRYYYQGSDRPKNIEII